MNELKTEKTNKTYNFINETLSLIWEYFDINTPIRDENSKVRIVFSVFTPEIDNYDPDTKIVSLPIVVAGWFNDYPSFQECGAHLAIVYSGGCLQHERAGVIGLKPMFLNYCSPSIPKKYYRKLISSHKKEFRERWQEYYKKWKRLQIEEGEAIKRCECCGREFIAKRSDARACHLSACKKALSRKKKLRTYNRMS